MMPAPALCPYPEPPARTGVVYAFPRAAPEPSITGGLPMLASGLVELLEGINAPRRRLRRKQVLFHAGQPCESLFLVHAGVFKTCMLSADGLVKVTGFHLRGDLLGGDSWGAAIHACGAVALDTSEVWELSISRLQARGAAAVSQVTTILAGEIRRDWRWMMLLSNLDAEQRVAVFLLDLAARLEGLGFSPRHLLLRMTRAELGNFLALQLETVTRVLTRLAGRGLIHVDGREIRIDDAAGLHTLATHPAACVSGH